MKEMQTKNKHSARAEQGRRVREKCKIHEGNVIIPIKGV